MAVPAKDDRAVFLSSGTWSLLGTELLKPQTDGKSRAMGFTNEMGYNGTTRYLKNIMGMWILQCIRKELNKKYSYAEMAALAAESEYEEYVDATDNRFFGTAGYDSGSTGRHYMIRVRRTLKKIRISFVPSP